MGTNASDGKSQIAPVRQIEGKEYQGRETREKCVGGYIHKITVDVYCCPLEEVVVSDEKTETKCP